MHTLIYEHRTPNNLCARTVQSHFRSTLEPDFSTAFLQLSMNEDILEVVSADAQRWFVLLFTSHPPTFTSSPVSCILYPLSILHPALKCISMHFFKSAQKIPAKGQAMPKGPLLDISYPLLWGTSLQTLSSPPHISLLHTECERWYAEWSGARKKELCKSCPPAFCVRLCTCAESKDTDTGWQVSSRWVSLGPRGDQVSHHGQAALLSVWSSEKPQGWDERQIGAQGQH